MKAIARMGLQPQADPNVIPFIDVLLVLLVIFMVTAPKPTVDLPFDAAQSGGLVSPTEPTVISLADGADGVVIFVNNEVVALDMMVERTILRALTDNPSLTSANVMQEARVYVRADLDIAYEDVVRVMDLLYSAHFARVAVIAQDADAA